MEKVELNFNDNHIKELPLIINENIVEMKTELKNNNLEELNNFFINFNKLTNIQILELEMSNNKIKNIMKFKNNNNIKEIKINLKANLITDI